MTVAPVNHRSVHSSRRPPAFRIETSSSLAAFADIWPTAADRRGAHCFPFQYADILGIWYETIGHARGAEPLFIAVLLPDGNPAFLLPLCIERSTGVRVLRFPDCGVSDYNAPVVFPPASRTTWDIDVLWQQIQSHLPPFDIALLEKMPDAVDGISNPFASLASETRHESCHYVTLTGTWDEFAAKRLPNMRDSRRRLRKLEERAPASFHIADNDADRQRFFDALIHMKRQRFAATGAYDIFSDGGYLEFYAEATRRLGPAGVVQVSALRAGNAIVAVNWGLYDGSRYIDLLPSYEAGEWAPCAPGRLLSEWLLRQHLERGDRVFDYGIGDEPYKFGYCDRHVALADAHLPVTSKGTLYSSALRLQRKAKTRLRETRLGPVLKVARNLLSRIGQGRSAAPARDTVPAWVALIGSLSLAIDA